MFLNRPFYSENQKKVAEDFKNSFDLIKILLEKAQQAHLALNEPGIRVHAAGDMELIYKKYISAARDLATYMDEKEILKITAEYGFTENFNPIYPRNC